MKAAVREGYGTLDIVRVDEVEQPAPTADQVLVRVRAASVNRGDLDGLGPRPGFARLFMGIRAPRITRMGLDAAGEVEAVGPSVTRFRPGDRVFSDLFNYGTGAFAEYVCAPERAFAQIPDRMSFEDAATLPHSAILAIQGLRLRNGRTIAAGDRVLIAGASGNVGPFAVQIAKARGAEVTGACRTEKVDFVKSLGADHVIDHTKVDYTAAGERYDWIVDTDSHHSIFRVGRALRPNGVYVTLGGNSRRILQAMLLGGVVSRASGKRLALLLWWKPFHADDLATVLGLIAAGKVKPAIDRRFPLAETVAALRYVDEGHNLGKVIVSG
jgi:NADPH:quinone reductase-like Zn-dependent oxidoreductase